jgi:hypothetical protein
MTAQSRPHLSRRDFLMIAAIAGVTTIGGHLAYTYTPWLNYEQQADHARRPIEDLTMPTPFQELVRYATLAANGHNTQPWKFAIAESGINIYPDYTRRLPVVDPDDREMWISLGCALENLLVAARAAGYAPEVTYPDSAADYIHVQFTADTPQAGALFDAIPARQNTRSEYDGQPIQTAALDQMHATPLEPGVELHFVTTPAGLETVLEYVNQGNLSQYADDAFVDELIDWLRFNKREALASLDGLYTRCTGNPEVPRWLGQMFMAGMKPQTLAGADAKKLRSSPGAVVIASESDDKAAWVRTGQVYERLALTMTSLGIRSAFLNQPIEVAALRPQFQRALGLGESQPQLIVRYGYADLMPRSPRRPVEQVLTST